MISYIAGVKEIDLKDFEAWSGGKTAFRPY